MATFHKVLVYGTLKRGEPNHHWFSRDGHQKFLRVAKTVEKYPLIIGTKYNIPFLLDSPGNGSNVTGEVYEVDDKMLANLDILEDHPNYYVRELRHVVYLEDNTVEKVWIYLIKNFKTELLNKLFYDNYSSFGSHGLKYVERYLRDKKYDFKAEIFE